ncbi:MAG: apolipoprotein N-acyltransferase, partial [Actinomycetota bacterium]
MLTGPSDDTAGTQAVAGPPPAGEPSTGGSRSIASGSAGPDGRVALPAIAALALAAVGGLALAGAFPPAGFWPLAAAGPALLTIALWRRSLRGSLAAGFVFGLAFFVPLLSWLVNLAWYAWIALAVAEALIFAVAAAGQRLLLNLRAWPVAVALWWVAAEALRDRWPFGGFPWGRLAMSQAGSPAGPWVAVGGAPLLTFLVAGCAAALAWLVLEPAQRGRPAWALRPRLLPAAALAAAVAITLGGTMLPVDQPGASASTATVAAVQGNVPQSRTVTGLLRATTVTANHA